MSVSDTKIQRNFNDGASQSRRLLPALHPDFVKVDERNFNDAVVFAFQFAELINYYNADNQPVIGKWVDFFAKDESVLLVLINETSIDDITATYNAISTAFFKGNNETKIAQLKAFDALIRKAAGDVDFWYTHSPKNNKNASTLFKELFNAITTRLREALQKQKAYALGFEDYYPDILQQDYDHFNSIWQLEDVQPIPILTGDTEFDRLISAFYKVRGTYFAFLDTLSFIVDASSVHLEESLTERQDHPAHVALYMAFIKLFRHSQNHLNTLTQRHLEYYYQKVLKQQPKAPVADQVYLTFELVEGFENHLVPAGSSLLGGKDEAGEDLAYITEHDLVVNQARIANLRTVFSARNKLVYPNEVFNYVTNIYASSEADIDGTTTQVNKGWPTFGEDQFEIGDSERTMRDAAVGFAITSPVLQLSEGDRTIDVVFEVNNKDFDLLLGQLQDIAKEEHRSFGNVLYTTFSEAFNINITAAEGWMEMTHYAVRLDRSTKAIHLTFQLENTDPAFVPYSVDLHGTNYETKWPVLQMILNPHARMFVYSLLEYQRIEKVLIDVEVEGMKDLVLYSNVGKLDPSQPFQPFGPIPTMGSYMLVGSEEVFQKELSSLQFNIEWQDLPGVENGFEAYYEAYNMGITNDSFEVKLSTLNRGKWKPSTANQQMFKLFNTSTNTEEKRYNVLDAEKTITGIDLKKIRKPINYYVPSEEPLEFGPATKTGFMKMELSNPSVAFGHNEYPQLLSDSIIKNTEIIARKSKEDPVPTPNSPYTPTIKEFTLNYSASVVMDIATRDDEQKKIEVGEFIHIHPFGHREVYPKSTLVDKRLLPQYDEEGNLYIGLENLNAPETLTMLFHLSEGSGKNDQQIEPAVEWSYLVDNNWVTFKSDNILKDTTGRFIKSGIITLEIPGDISKNNTIMSADLYWIKAMVPSGAKLASRIIDVKTQAVTAKWKNNGNNDYSHLVNPLPAGSISSFIDDVPQIATVTQPLESFSGRGKESSVRMYARISERLRHKKRGIVGWDYERLVLEKFPSIYKVKCLTPNSEEKSIAPGTVVLVVIPDVTNKDSIDRLEPKAPTTTLSAIRDYMKQFVSPFVKVTVRNPFYEQIKVICKVRFIQGANNGYYIQKLSDDIKRYLSPWLFDDVNDVKLGASVRRSDLLGFVESQDYVEFITGFSVLKITEVDRLYSLTDTAWTVNEDDELVKHQEDLELKAGHAWSVLVSTPHHDIEILEEEEELAPEPRRIENMLIGEDLIVQKKEKIRNVGSIMTRATAGGITKK